MTEKLKKFLGLKKNIYNKLFRVTDALGSRNRKKAWAEYHKLLLNRVPPEEIFWKLVWQVKNMLIASSVKSAKEAGLIPFVFDKSRNYARNYGRRELIEMSEKLVSIYSHKNRGLCDLDIALEQFLISI